MKINPIHRELVIPSSFAECFTYELQIAWLKKEIDNVATGGGGESVKVLEEKVAALENSVATLKNKTNTLTTSITEIEREINSIKTDLDNIKRNLENFATKDDIKDFISEERIDEKLEAYESIEHAEATYVKKGATGDYVTEEQLDNKLTDYATKIELQEYVTDEQLEDYLTKTEAEDTYAKKGEIPSDVLTKTEAASTYATKEEIPDVEDFITETEADEKYAAKESLVNLTTNDEFNTYKEEVETDYAKKSELPDLTDYAKKSELPDLSDYATKPYVDMNFLAQDDFDEIIQNYPEKSELNKYVTTEVAEETYAKKGEIPSDVLTKTEAASTYATKEEIPDVEDFATKQELTNGLNEKVSINTFDSVVETLATKENVEATYAKKEDIPDVSDFVTDDELSERLEEYATKEEIPEGVIVDFTVSADGQNPVKSQGIYNFVVDQIADLVTTEMLATKQDKLTFDEVPTAGSSNPVKSSGIKTAIEEATNDMLTNTEAALTYATKSEIPSLDNYVTKSEISDMATMNGKLETITETIEANEATPTSYLQSVTATFNLSHTPVNGVYTIDEENIYEFYRFGASNTWYKKKKGTSSINENVITVVTSSQNDGVGIYTNPGKSKIKVTYQYKSIGLNDCETKEHAEATYAKKEDIPDVSNYLTKTVADETYVNKNDISDFVTEGEVDDKLLNYVDVEEFNTSMMNKQDKLTFDETPTEGSSNPVTSDGIFNVVKAIPQVKRQIISNDIIANNSYINASNTYYYLSSNQFTVDKIELEYEKDVYNLEGMWFLDCNLIITINANIKVDTSYIAPHFFKTTATQNKEWYCKLNDIIIECYSETSNGFIYRKGNYQDTVTTTQLYRDISTGNYLIPEKAYQINSFRPISTANTKIVFTAPLKIASQTQFTVDTAII